MSLAYSDTSNGDGILQRIEDICGFNATDITGNTTLLKKFTARVNATQNKIWAKIFQIDGTWQWDDSNQTADYPIIKTNIVADQRDYSFINDENSNRILDIHKVAILKSATDTLFDEIKPVDAQSGDYSPFVVDDTARTGTPYQYDKTANAIFLDPIPSYSATNGLKVYINREGYYFTTSDTTKVPGFAGTFHELLVLGPAYEYARDRGLAVADRLFRDMTLMEEGLEQYYSGSGS